MFSAHPGKTSILGARNPPRLGSAGLDPQSGSQIPPTGAATRSEMLASKIPRRGWAIEDVCGRIAVSPEHIS